MAGEKELREQQLQDLQKKLARLEGEISTAENDRKQFDADAKRAESQQIQFRYIKWFHLVVLLSSCCPLLFE